MPVMRIGVIGLGTIATALVTGIAGDGHRITVSMRGRRNAARLADRFVTVAVAENQQVIDRSDVLFLGLTGAAAPDTLAALRFRAGQRVVSLMADLCHAATADLVAPATLVARMIPFPAIATGGSPILCCGDRALVDDLFGARNTVFPVPDEAALNAFLCAQAVLSPATAMVGDAADWLARSGACDPDTADAFLRSLVASSLTGSECAVVLRALDAPGGFNRRLRDHMADSGMGAALRTGLDRLRD